MNIQKIIIVVVLLVLAAGGYYLIRKDTTEPSVTTETGGVTIETEDSVTTNKKGVGSLMQLMGLGQNTMCTFSYADSNTGQTSSGEFYYDSANSKFRVNSITQDTGAVYVTHMINDSENVYMWSDGEGEEAFAMKIPASTGDDTYAQNFESSEPNRPLSMDQNVDYDCDMWRVDQNLLVPPSTIEFMDMTSMMQGMKDVMPEGFALPAGFPGQ